MPSTRMKQERINRKWTQKTVAERIGVTPTSISDIENGNAKPGYVAMCKLEDLFKMGHRKLLEVWEDTP